MDNILIYHTQDGKVKVELYEFGQSVWLTQELIAKLFDTSRENITTHIKNIFEDSELREEEVCKENLHTAKDGKQYKVKFKIQHIFLILFSKIIIIARNLKFLI